MDQAQVLSELEALLSRFFDSSSTNEQKLEINKILESFSQQQGVWHYCTYFLCHSASQHVCMYALNVLENVVSHVWPSLELSERAELRRFLLDHLLSCHASLPLFLRKKLVKTIVLVGRADWPRYYPEFFSNILQLVHGSDTTALGLSLLLSCSEELICPHSDLVPSARKEELRCLLSQQLPTVLSMLLHILDVIATKHLNYSTYSHPPQPPSSTSSTSSPSPSLSLKSPIATHHRAHLHTSPTSSPSSPSSSASLSLSLTPSLTSHQSNEISSLCLQCLAHLFSWMPLSSLISPYMLDTIFHFASLGCDSVSDASDCLSNLGSLAMDCVNELLVKNCVPREFEAFLMKLFEKSFALLLRLTGESATTCSSAGYASGCNFSKLDDRFLAKCSDFFYWFVSSHLKRVEFNPAFPVLEFLGLFCKYTLKQPEIDSFCICLDTWGVFLEHLIATAQGSRGSYSPPSAAHYQRYQDTLVAMTKSVLTKIQLHFNIDELREVDDDTIDDDNETEWQSFLRQSLEFVGRVSELFPSEVFQMILPLLDNYSLIYLSLTQLISSPTHSSSLTPTPTPGTHHQSHRGDNVRMLAIADKAECERLHAVLKDLSSILQALGRLSEHFIGDRFQERLLDAQALVKQICYIAKYSSSNMLCDVTTPMPEILEHDFIELHAQVLGTLRAFAHWLAQFYVMALRDKQQGKEEDILNFVTAVVESSVILFSPNIPEKIILSACQLFLSLTATVRPHFLSSLPLVQRLVDRASQGELMQSLPNKACVMVYQALCNLCVLPWVDVGDSLQQWEVRTSQLSGVVGGATRAFQRAQAQQQQVGCAADASALQKQAKPELKQTLNLLEELISPVAHESSRSRAVLHKSLHSSIEFGLSLFPLYLRDADILDALMGFYLAVFGTFKSHVGPEFTKKLIETFMTLLTREQLEETLLQEASVGSKMVEKFLNILQLLIEDNGSSYLPNVISFTMSQIYPIVAEKPAPDVKSALYTLLFKIMLNNWRYFYPGTVLAHMDEDSNEPVNHEAELMVLLQSFGQSFMQGDIALFKQNLASLEVLNEKHKLYTKVQFCSGMLYPFLQILMQVLVHKSHDLLQEEVCACVHNMAMVDLQVYHQQFLPKFLTSIEGLTDAQRSELSASCKMHKDMPSFVQNLRQFSSDLRYYLLLNGSQPAGSVRLS